MAILTVFFLKNKHLFAPPRYAYDPFALRLPYQHQSAAGILTGHHYFAVLGHHLSHRNLPLLKAVTGSVSLLAVVSGHR